MRNYSLLRLQGRMIITDSIEIRRLAQDDAVLYRHIRLEALQASPEVVRKHF